VSPLHSDDIPWRVSDEKLWDESPTSRHLQVHYHQTSFQVYNYHNNGFNCVQCSTT